jgi:membrane protein DedA with SNARE-associated domain
MLAYLLVGAVIGVESMGLPVPGEITLVSASLLAAAGALSPWGVGIAAALGAIVGDSIGYAIGRRGGRPLLERMGRRFPKHLGPNQMAKAEQQFQRWGTWAVFFGRFVALLRILAGPMAGALKVPYPKFLLANAAGGIIWAGGTTWALYVIGHTAAKWLSEFSWIALAVAVAAGVSTTWFLRRRARLSAMALVDPEAPQPAGPATRQPKQNRPTTKYGSQPARSGRRQPAHGSRRPQPSSRRPK